MALLKRRRTKRLVLDIGSSAIRLCEISPTKAGYQLTKYYQRELGISPAHSEEEKAERRATVLSALLKEAKVRTKKTIVCVAGQSVFTRNRPLPPVPEYKVTQIVRYEIQQQIPFSLDQIALDYQVLDRTEAGGYDVMMAAIKVDVVEKQLEVLNKTKRSIDVVDVAPLAAYNWLRHTGEFGEEGECVALLDMGASTTDIVIQKDNYFRFTRSLSFGGNDVTNAIAKAFNQTFDEAEKLKRERGFAPTGDPQRDGRGGEVIGGELSRLVGEISRSLAYFRSQPGGGPTSRVIVTGGGACLRNIIPYLQRSLGIEVRIAQPLAGLAIAPGANEASEHPEQACVVLGLALRCNQTVPIQINLIPPRVLEFARRKEQAFYWMLSLVTLYLILASIIPITARKDALVLDEIKFYQDVLASYDPALIADPTIRSDFEDQLMFVKSDIKALDQEVQDLDNVRTNRNFWLKYLLVINQARPSGGGIAFSSIESAVLGGDGNTGDPAREAKKRKEEQSQGDGAPEATPVEEEKPDDPAPAATGLSGLSGLSGLAGLAAAAGSGGGTGALKVSEEYEAKGFPGIYPGGANRGGGASSIGGLGRSSRRSSSSNVANNVVIEPNGIIIKGYATDPDRLERFVNRLREVKEFDGMVYFHVSQSDDVRMTELDNASGGGGASRGSGGRRRSSGGGLGGLSGGGLGGGLGGLSGGLGGLSGRRAGPGRVLDTGQTITRFRIDVQFLGQKLPEPDEFSDSGRGSGRGLGGLGGLAGLGGRR